MPDTQVDIAIIKENIAFIKKSLDGNDQQHLDISQKIDGLAKIYATKQRIRPLEVISYGLAGGALMFTLNQVLNLLDTAKAVFF